MSDFISEARVLIRPDTSRFRAELEAQLRAVTAKPLVVPVKASVTGAAESRATTRALTQDAAQVALLQKAGADAATKAAAAQREHAQALGQVNKAAIANTAGLLGLRGAVLTAGTAFIGATVAIQSAVKGLQEFSRFETSLNVFRVTADATASDMARVSAAARQLGSDLSLPGVSANDAADALAQLSRAGLTVDDSLDGVRGTLQLATAAAISNADAVNLVASALNAFALSGSQAVKVADLLAASANESQGSILDMGLALQQSAAAAHQSGVSLEDTTALLTILARAGLRGSDAGTSLRVALLRLINPSKAAAQELRRLNVNIRDAFGNIRPEVFADLVTSMQNFTRAQRDAALATIFGADAFRAAAIIGAQGRNVLDETRAATQKQGVAAEVAAARTQGFAGSVEKLKNAASNLGLELGDAFGGPVGAALNIFASALQKTADGIGFVTGLSKDISEVNEEQAKSWVKLVQKVGEFNQAASDLGKTRGDLPALEALIKRLEEEFPKTTKAGLFAADAIETYRDAIHNAALQSESLNNRIDESTNRFEHVAQAAAKAADAVSLFLSPSEKTRIGAIEAQATPGLSDDIANAQAELDRAEKRLREFKPDASRPAKSRATFASLQEDVARARTALALLLRQQAEEATAAARAADDAAKAQIAAEDQSTQNRLALSRAQAENRIAAAALTPALVDDIRQQRAYIRLLEQQENVIRKQIHDADLRKTLIAQLNAAEIAAQKTLDDLIDQRKENQQRAKDALTDILSQRLRLAELRGNDKEILAALNAAIANARKRVAAAKTLSDKLDEQIKLQELLNEKNDILGKSQTDGASAAREFFDQLQGQAGFVSNLLGNLIPRNQTAGLVGVPSPPAAGSLAGTGLGLPPVRPGVVDIGLGAAGAAAAGRALTSPTAGQASTTNEILRRILNQLQILNRAQSAPEATYQARMGRSIMDSVGAVVDTVF